MKISLIAALSENRVIGKDNKLPWDIMVDLKRFREKTSGHPIIMGRKTFESIGRPLPNRTNIVITRNKDWKQEGVEVANSLDEAIEFAKKKDEEEIFIIGGGQIFAEAIKKADKLYLTLVHIEIEGDAYFPDYSEFKKEIFREDHEENGLKFSFIDLEM